MTTIEWVRETMRLQAEIYRLELREVRLMTLLEKVEQVMRELIEVQSELQTLVISRRSNVNTEASASGGRTFKFPDDIDRGE